MVTREWNNMVIIVCLGWVGSGRKRNERRREKKEDRERGSVCPRRSGWHGTSETKKGYIA